MNGERRTVGVNVQFDRRLHDRLRRAAYEERRAQAEIVRQAVSEYLSRRGHMPEERRR